MLANKLFTYNMVMPTENGVTNDIIIPIRTTLISLDIYKTRRTPYLHPNQDENFHKVTYFTHSTPSNYKHQVRPRFTIGP
jgi:hypothetical protein